MDRWDLDIHPGGRIAVWCDGAGTPIVLVHGSMTDHRALDRLASALSRNFSTFALDRRGFGSSPETGLYSAEREFTDVGGVVDAVAGRAGRPVALFGHSWGASCALGAACLSRSISHLLLYEPSLGLAYPPGYVDRLQRLIDLGDHEAAVVAVLTDVAGMSADDIDVARSGPDWLSQVATAWTIARESRIEETWVHIPGEFDTIDIPTLLISGSETPPELAAVTRLCAKAISGSSIHLLAGHGHFAHDTDPIGLAEVVKTFVDHSSGSVDRRTERKNPTS